MRQYISNRGCIPTPVDNSLISINSIYREVSNKIRDIIRILHPCNHKYICSGKTVSRTLIRNFDRLHIKTCWVFGNRDVSIGNVDSWGSSRGVRHVNVSHDGCKSSEILKGELERASSWKISRCDSSDCVGS